MFVALTEESFQHENVWITKVRILNCHGIIYYGCVFSYNCGAVFIGAATARELAAVRSEMYWRFQERQLSVDVGGKKYKKCPSCKVQIEKNGGCNRMTCRCGQMFCWICRTKVTGYGHFEDSCKLFPEHRYVNNQVTFHDGYVAYRAALIRNENAKQQKYPRCRNKSVKSSRLNLIKCWFCKGHFCIQCGSDLTKLSQPTHYHTSKTCTQHSDE